MENSGLDELLGFENAERHMKETCKIAEKAAIAAPAEEHTCAFCHGDVLASKDIRDHCVIFRRAKYRVSNKAYAAHTLGDNDIAGFAAAGVDVVCGKYHLFIREKRGGKDKLNFVGGRRDFIKERPEETAAREFGEEAGGLLAGQLTPDVLRQSNIVWWAGGHSKYVIFRYTVPKGQEQEFVQLVQQSPNLRLSTLKTARPHLHKFAANMIRILKWRPRARKPLKEFMAGRLIEMTAGAQFTVAQILEMRDVMRNMLWAEHIPGDYRKIMGFLGKIGHLTSEFRVLKNIESEYAKLKNIGPSDDLAEVVDDMIENLITVQLPDNYGWLWSENSETKWETTSDFVDEVYPFMDCYDKKARERYHKIGGDH